MRRWWLPLAALASALVGCSPVAFEAVLRMPEALAGIGNAIDAASRSRGNGSAREASEAMLSVVGRDHERRMKPLRELSADLLAGEVYWQRGTARFLVVVRTSQPGQAVLGLQVAETRAGSTVDVICEEAAACADGSNKLRVDTMRWLRTHRLELAEYAPALPLSAVELEWREPNVTLVRNTEPRELRALPSGATPYAVALSSDGSLALLRIRGRDGEQATIVRIPDAPPASL